MCKTILLLIPIAAGLYGGAVGGYIHSKNRSPKHKITLGIIGIVLILIWIVALIGAFAE